MRDQDAAVRQRDVSRLLSDVRDNLFIPSERRIVRNEETETIEDFREQQKVIAGAIVVCGD